MYTSAARMPLWKWILCLVFGLGIFYAFYYFSLLGGIGLQGKSWLRVFYYLGVGLLGLLAYAVWTNLTERRPVEELAFNSLSFLGIGITFGAVWFSCVVGVMALMGHFSITEAHFDGPMWIGYVMYFFTAAVFEEILFRGILFRLIDDRWNTMIAMLFSALIFGGLHMMNPGATMWSSFAISLEAGLLLGAAFKCSGNLWMPIGIHWAWNVFQGPVFGFPVSGNPVQHKIFSTIVSGPEWITGGVFGPEAALPALGTGLLLLLIFIFHCKPDDR
ncbi:MAG: CPBP family intramembrane metalloprotease [Bacteroidales bacterium]|nr:CPBP family intramembrane metalloprotease [Bacteroidales bacterium]